MTAPFGDYDDQDDVIRANPPAAVGNPEGKSVALNLKSLFEKSAPKRITLEADAPNGTLLELEFDLELTAEDFERYEDIGRGLNRSGRRGKKSEDLPPIKRHLFAAAMLAEKSTKITVADTRQVFEDGEGHDLTLSDPLWLEMAGNPGDPVAATLGTFGDLQVIALGDGYVRATPLGQEKTAVPPTSG